MSAVRSPIFLVQYCARDNCLLSPGVDLVKLGSIDKEKRCRGIA